MVPGTSGLDKRQVTIQLCILAQGEQFVPPWIILRGGKCPTEAERVILDSMGIEWYFQPKAWADGKFSRKWLRWFCALVQEHCPGPHLLFIDGHPPQLSPRFNEIAFRNNVFPFAFPPNCTDLVQPVDHHVGIAIKQFMHKLYLIELKNNYDLWRSYKSSGALSASHRRMLMAEWLDIAWSLIRENSHLLFQAFESTGLLIQRDGSHNTKLRGLKDPYDPFV